MKSFVLITGLLILIAAEILRVYFIMPFPGSQKKETIGIAYWLDQNIWWLRILLLVIIAIPVLSVFKQKRVWKKILLGLGLAVYAFIFYMFNFRFLAEKMFIQPTVTAMLPASQNKMPMNGLVIGIHLNGESKAYPITLIGYHHQVRDTIGSTPIMVTYCTVCRTGRIFSPQVNGKNENFRLVGMDHFNAMFEDATTKSWWRQVTGEAIAGPLKGTRLNELASQQTTLAAWLALHPTSTIMQPDTIFQAEYDDMEGFDDGTIKSSLEKRDSLSWQNKSWVIGVQYKDKPIAYDWNRLIKEQIIHDTLPGLPLVITISKDTTDFYVLNRLVNGASLKFEKLPAKDSMVDSNTSSVWNINGLCVDGPMKGKQLQPVRSYQEFWHSWKTFHPTTKKY